MRLGFNIFLLKSFGYEVMLYETLLRVSCKGDL
ncbi:MAG: hypothetical protein RLZZ422_91 [Pseudomonadota bacterium]|jgi:hypothetical protein